MKSSRFLQKLEDFVFSQRILIIALFAVITIFMGWSASRLKIDAGFDKLVPMQHEYMQTFSKHRADFGGANRVLLALARRNAVRR